MADYPDHLNPFKRTGLRQSFRSIGLRFWKKKDHQEKRSHSQVPTSQSTGTLLRREERPNGAPSVPRSETIIGAGSTAGTLGTPEVFPRSRFNERVTKAQTIDGRTMRTTVGNPFDDDVGQQAHVQPNGGVDVCGTDTTRRRRHKKRAPLPPGARDRLMVPGDHNTSQWSIDSYTSYDTDCSTTTTTALAHSEGDEHETNPETAERLKDIQEISKEIQVYCDDDPAGAGAGSNPDETIPSENARDDNPSEAVNEEDGNVLGPQTIADEEQQKNDAIPSGDCKVCVSPPADDAVVCDISEAIVEEAQSVTSDEINNNHVEDAKTDSVDAPKSTLSSGDVTEVEATAIQHAQEIAEQQVDRPETPPSQVEEFTELTKAKDVQEPNESCDTPAEVTSKDSNHNGGSPTEDLQHDDIVDDIDENSKDIAYVNRKSIYVESTDGLQLHEREANETTLYITGSCDQLDADGATPTPKMRKHKLGREVLLGSTEMGLNTSEKQ